jgi:hypothetical protein
MDLEAELDAADAGHAIIITSNSFVRVNPYPLDVTNRLASSSGVDAGW